MRLQLPPRTTEETEEMGEMGEMGGALWVLRYTAKEEASERQPKQVLVAKRGQWVVRTTAEMRAGRRRGG